MNEADKERVIAKKKQVQVQLAVAAESKLLEDWWLPTLEIVMRQNVKWRMEYFNIVDDATYGFWQQQLKQAPWATIAPDKLILREGSELYVHENVLRKFPGTLPLRYLPDLDVVPSSAGFSNKNWLQTAMNLLKVKDEPVYFFFMRLPPIIILNASDILSLVESGLLDVPEDICITSPKYDWLIFRSLEGEWRFGKN